MPNSENGDLNLSDYFHMYTMVAGLKLKDGSDRANISINIAPSPLIERSKLA